MVRLLNTYTKEECREAIRAIASMNSKSEKAQQKLQAETWQHTMTVQARKAYRIAIALLNRELETNPDQGPWEGNDARGELEDALKTVASVIERIEKAQPKFVAGTPWHTLSVRRMKALHLASALIKRELGL